MWAVGEDAPRAPRDDGLVKPFARGAPFPPRADPSVFPLVGCPKVAVAFEWPPRGMVLLLAKPRPRALEAPRAVLLDPLPRPRPRPAVPNEGSMVVASADSDGGRHVSESEDKTVDACERKVEEMLQRVNMSGFKDAPEAACGQTSKFDVSD